MKRKYTEYDNLNLPSIAAEILEFWKQENIFEKSVTSRENSPSYVFYEGPPSANGLPGIHHVMSRTIKDIFCRFNTQKGFQVQRKAGWDTHGLPVELGVEKELGITKEDIGKKITIEEYNEACKKAVMRYTDIWNDLTEKMGYWVDMDNPYVTYHNTYIESVWNLLYKLYEKGLLYKGYTIQPYSPAAGTGLSSHELNQPGCYRDVKDTTIVAQFLVRKEQEHPVLTTLNLSPEEELFCLAWTTTPWTLSSNTALAVGKNIDYVAVKTYNPYTYQPVVVIVAEVLMNKYFHADAAELKLESYTAGDKLIPFVVLGSFKGSELNGLKYHQLMPFAQPKDGAEPFKVIVGDFVSTEDGTGIVHIAPTFGADDARVAKENGISGILVDDENGNQIPLVDLKGRFVKEMGEYAGRFVKNEYYKDGEAPERSVDVDIAIQLKEQNRAFKVEKYEHSYPHCWRTDKPVLYYPLDSWFIKATALKERMIELNKTINWKPERTGSGRFGEWLKNLNDWNLSRSRFWGIPIPIWATEDKSEMICIGSVEQLQTEINKSIAAGILTENPLADFVPNDFSKENYNTFDLHKNIVDKIVLVSPSGKPMVRESDLIDVWFDSGAMPYAQLHYPFENKDVFERNYPADFIAEGVDQTRGWFYTLHAIATMCFDSVAYKNVVSNGLVLDKNGLKMSKRLGNTVDPFKTLAEYGPDATRWYMISNAQPWDNLKFDLDGITEVQRKFFRALHNTYAFFALYANIDGFNFSETSIALNERPEIDRWVISRLNSLIQAVEEALSDYEPTKAARLIQDFVVNDLSNWYVRLCRKRFWRGDYSEDKVAAYQTLYTCLETVAKLAAPIAPFYADKLFRDLNQVTVRNSEESVHLTLFPVADSAAIDADLEERMELAQRASSLILGLRKKEKIKVRQPLQKILVPVLEEGLKEKLQKVEELILTEVNVKEIEFITDTHGVINKKIKPNFKTLGKKYGKHMKSISAELAGFDQKAIANLEINGGYRFTSNNETIELTLEDVELQSEDIPGWTVAADGNLTVALDINISPFLRQEGLAREFVNRMQNLRKDKGFEVTDRIKVIVKNDAEITPALNSNLNYICPEILADSLEIVNNFDMNEAILVELDETISTHVIIQKLN